MTRDGARACRLPPGPLGPLTLTHPNKPVLGADNVTSTRTTPGHGRSQFSSVISVRDS